MDLKEMLSSLEVQERVWTKTERVTLLLNEMMKNVPPMLVSMMPLVLPFDIDSLNDEMIENYLETVKQVVNWVEEG